LKRRTDIMKRLQRSAVWGILLIAGGVLVLLQNFGIVAGGLAIIWATLFGIAGLVFLYVFATNRQNWWAVIPGFALLGITALIAMSEFAPRSVQNWGGGLFLGSIGLCFWVIYLTKREFWWAIIPGGILTTLALVAGLDPIIGGLNGGAIFFLGIGLTFGAVAALPTPKGRMKWALIPAAVMLVIGILIMAPASDFLKFLLPAAIIIAGAYLIYRSFRSRQSQ
jgi:hypothetical protein